MQRPCCRRPLGGTVTGYYADANGDFTVSYGIRTAPSPSLTARRHMPLFLLLMTGPVGINPRRRRGKLLRANFAVPPRDESNRREKLAADIHT
jgi:hypothetical protein